MMSQFSKKLIQFYQVSLVLVMFCTLGTILYFWQLGFIDGSRSKNLHQASFIIESYQKDKSLSEIYSNVINENPRLAIEKAKEIESELGQVHAEIEVEGYKNLKNDIQKLKTSAANLISFSKVDKVVNVFNIKMNKFYDYVKGNNWRTLTRMSDRVFSQTKGHINKGKLGSLVTSVNRDFETMIKVTENSILTRKDKSEIISRIANLQIEIQMLKKYSDEIRFFKQLYGDTKKSLNFWITKISPEITYQKLQSEQMGKYYVMGLMGILGILTGIFFLSFAVNKWLLGKSQDSLESFVEEFVSEQILEAKNLNDELFSNEFKDYARNISKYFHKRMSFGSIFQDALPLASILLDKNLKVVWSNKQFCHDWELDEEEVKKDYMSWDFLSKLTNIGSDDPVLDALKNGVAGIYQVQVKPNDQSALRPYEMFVAPVKYQGETKVMIFFYDLTNIEQTIQDQAQTLISPIRKSLDVMLNPGQEVTDDIASEFDIAGINDIFEKFSQLRQMIGGKEEQLLDQIEVLHGQINSYEELIEGQKDHLDKVFEQGKTSTQSLKVFKDAVINLSQLVREYDRASNRAKEVLFANINALRNSSSNLSVYGEVMEEILFALPKFDTLKEDIKFAKASLYETKSRLGHELSQVNIYLKRDLKADNQENIVKVVNKLNKTFDLLNTQAEELDRKVTSLELMMSKASMVINSGQSKIKHINTSYEQQQILFSEGEVSSIKKLTTGKDQEIDTVEAEIVESLQHIFTSSKSQISVGMEMRNQINELHS